MTIQADSQSQCADMAVARNPLSLQVLAMDRVIPHERTDPDRVAPLRHALQRDGILKNPPIVMAWRDCFVVLDGATRVTAFRELDYPYIVAQVVSPNDEQVALDTWSHVILNIEPEALCDLVHTMAEVELVRTRLAEAERTMTELDGLCYLILPDKRAFVIRGTSEMDRLVGLNKLVAAYIHQEHTRIGRTTNRDFDLILSEYPSLKGVFIFPKYTIDQVLQISESGNVVPAGITRFIIPGRVLRLNLDLRRLQQDEPLVEKTAWLDHLIETRIADRQVRYYQEPVYLLDE